MSKETSGLVNVASEKDIFRKIYDEKEHSTTILYMTDKGRLYKWIGVNNFKSEKIVCIEYSYMLKCRKPGDLYVFSPSGDHYRFVDWNCNEKKFEMIEAVRRQSAAGKQEDYIDNRGKKHIFYGRHDVEITSDCQLKQVKVVEFGHDGRVKELYESYDWGYHRFGENFLEKKFGYVIVRNIRILTTDELIHMRIVKIGKQIDEILREGKINSIEVVFTPKYFVPRNQEIDENIYDRLGGGTEQRRMIWRRMRELEETVQEWMKTEPSDVLRIELTAESFKPKEAQRVQDDKKKPTIDELVHRMITRFGKQVYEGLLNGVSEFDITFHPKTFMKQNEKDEEIDKQDEEINEQDKNDQQKMIDEKMVELEEMVNEWRNTLDVVPSCLNIKLNSDSFKYGIRAAQEKEKAWREGIARTCKKMKIEKSIHRYTVGLGKRIDTALSTGKGRVIVNLRREFFLGPKLMDEIDEEEPKTEQQKIIRERMAELELVMNEWINTASTDSFYIELIGEPSKYRIREAWERAKEASGKIKQDNDEMTKPKPTKKATKMQSELVKVQHSNRNIETRIEEIYKIVNQIDRKIGNTMELFERNIINRYNQHIEMLENDIESLNESNHALVNKIKSLKF